MNKLRTRLSIWSLGLAMAQALYAGPSTFMVEGESFQFPGEWAVQGKDGASGGKVLMTISSVSDAMTVVQITSAGRYSIWTRSMDFPQDRPGARRYRVVVDDVPVEKESGQHGHEGWYWEKVGEMELPAGEHVLALRDTAKCFGRCDAILFTTDGTNPNDISLTELGKLRVAPLTTKVQARRVGSPHRVPAVLAPGERPVLAQVQSDRVRLAFRAAKDVNGRDRIVRQTELKVGDKWVALPIDGHDEMLTILSAANSGVSVANYFPTWTQNKEFIEFDVNGKPYRTSTGGRNPFMAGESQVLQAKTCRVVDANTIEVEYAREDSQATVASGTWRTLPSRWDVNFQLTFVAPKAGDYSVGFCGFSPWDKDREQFHLLPPLFQFGRMPKEPAMITSAITPHPLTLAQGTLQGLEGSWTFAVAADPQHLPFVWPTAENARYGFTLQNPQLQVQPAAFEPVLGLEGSRLKAGESKTVSFYVLAMPGDWKAALEYTSKVIFGVQDYRKQETTSLSHAAENLFALMKDDNAGGWDARLKGHYNIEAAGVVTQASPLTPLSAAILSDDEDMYVRRALPSLEYTLSRPSAHFALKIPAGSQGYVKPETLKLTVPTKFFGTAYWQGVYELLGRANPWIAELAVDNGQVRYAKSYSAMPHWSELMGVYRLKPEAGTLQQIEKECQEFLDQEVYRRKTGELGLDPFYNISFYSYWWDLMDLYDLTHNPKYLAAAEEGAFHTMAGQWVAPKAPEEMLTIHPQGVFKGIDHLWWKGEGHYRLGFPRKDNDLPEKSVPAWKVSEVGLGFEQPCTYYHPQGPMLNIMMSAWAPNLLRVYGATGREIYQTFARNSIIERFGSYPGYYVPGQTDAMQDPQYPYRGPDLTSIYYHHIPPHMAFTLDFLVTEAGVRSKDAIRFPWVRQQGYVWFTNRLYGFGTGRIFDDSSARLKLDRNLADVASEKVNYVLGRGDHRLWVVLLNESDAEEVAPIRLGSAAQVQLDRPYEIYDAKGTVIGRGTPAAQVSVKVPAKGLIAVAFPAADTKSPTIPPVENGHVVREIGGEWGQLHAFRIRSPFGKDSLYVVLTGRPAEGSVASVAIDGQKDPLLMTRFPYECSVYPWPMNQDLKLHVKLVDAKGQGTDGGVITLPGTPSPLKSSR